MLFCFQTCLNDVLGIYKQCGIKTIGHFISQSTRYASIYQNRDGTNHKRRDTYKVSHLSEILN
jgi:hypothetical protein